MTERLPCEVPGCRRTCKRDAHTTEWICANHWREVSRRLRVRYARARRRRDRTRFVLLWQMAKEQAICRAFGI